MPLWNKPSSISVPAPAHLASGAWAEQQAERYLTAQGLRCKERNFSCKQGEIDLIMVSDQDVIFVEVRFRKQSRFGSAVETVNQRKQHKLRLAAETYLQQHQLTNKVNCRFDVVGVSRDATATAQIEWIKNAF